MSKKNIIAIIAIVVLLFIAGISVGVFLYDKGETEAVDGNQIVDETQVSDGTQAEENIQNSENNNQPENADLQESVTYPDAGDEDVTTTGNEVTVEVENNDTENNNENVNNEVETENTDVTTNTNVNEVGETTISRVEEQERLVSRDFWDWWKPVEVEIIPTAIGVREPQITVKKAVITGVARDELTYIGQDITYVIAVTNNGEDTVENIEITDKIPQNTTFVSIKDAKISSEVVGTKTTIGTDNKITGVKWGVTIPAGETVIAEFTVNVNKTMINEDGEEVETTGTILNTAIANGEESNDGEPTKTSIIRTNKSSVITRLNKETEKYEEVQSAKIGDLITYTITVENTGDSEGTTYILDKVPEGTKLISAEEAMISENADSVAWSVTLDANQTITRQFTVEVVSINSAIKNVADVGGTPTNEDKVETADIEIIKTVIDIKREGVSIGKDAEVKDGDVIEYKITITNTGSKDLTKVEVIEKLEGVEVVEGNLSIGDLKSGESKDIIVTYTVSYDKDIKNKSDRTILNEVTVSGETIPNQENPDEKVEKVEDEDDVTTPVEETPLIDIEKTATAVNGEQITETTTVRPGDVIEYKIKVDNIGNITLNNIEITDSLKVKIDETEKDANTVIYTIETLDPNAEPVEITVYYTVTETDCAELQKIKNVATGTAEDGITDNDEDETIEVNPDITISITKIWADANNQDGKRPSEITINLHADGEYVKSQTISETTYTFDKLPKYNEQKTEIIYTVTENEVAEYTTTYSEDTLTITNTHVPETISLITVTKAWEDNNNQDGIRPDSVSVSLLANGTVKQTTNITAINNWVISFEELPVYENGDRIEYSIIENNVPVGYSENITGNITDGFVVTNTHTPETTEVTVTKAWSDNNDQDGIRPDKVNVTLYADGIEVQTAEVKAEENWTYTFNNLPKYRDGGVEIVYTVDEVQLPTGYKKSVSGNTITNTHTPETIEVTVTKVWSDNNDQDGIRPDSVNVTLYADGAEVQTAEVKAEENWTYTFNNLAKYRDGGVEIVYTVDEVQLPTGYTKTVEGNTITNTHTPETTQVTVTKSWSDNNNQDGIRPGSVNITLYADGTEVQTAEVKAEENWTYTFSNLAKYRDGGVEIVYTVDEIQLPTGYTKSVEGNTITNTHIPETTEVTVTKAWNDNNDQDGIRPDSVNITLYADGAEVQTAEVKAEENWTYTFSNLAKYRDGGVEIVYTVDETVVPTGYTKSVSGNTITNTHTPETTEVTVTKAWNDNNDQDGIRPDSVNITLYADGVEVQTAEVKAEENWTYTFNNLAKYRDGGVEIVYTVDEVQLPTGYTKTVEGNTITNTHTPETTQVTVTKSWSDNNNQDGIRPDKVNVTLYADGVEVQTAEVKAEENWTYTFSNLTKYRDGGVEIVYTIDEIEVAEGYTKSVDGYTVTNTHTPATKSITVNKIWEDNNNQDGIRPQSVNISLLADGTVKETVDILATEGWIHTFENLPEKSNGKAINYTVTENTIVSGYQSVVDGYTITNTHNTEKTSITVTKAWDDNNDQDGIRPDSVELTLYANTIEKQTVTVNEENNWSYTFNDLPVNENGIAIQYSVDEKTVTTRYEKTVNGYTVKNTYVPETTEVTVTKAWSDNNDQDGIRPDSVNITLYADGTEVQTAEVKAEENWTYTFRNLAKYRDGGIEIVYTIDETELPTGYTKSVEGNTITNTHTPETTEVTVTKVWSDNNDQDGIRPGSVNITLYADGEEVQTAEVKAEENWTYTFNNLPKYKDGGVEIVYTVDETELPTGYTKTVEGNTITNTHTPETTKVTVTKAWSDNNDQDGIRPDSVNITLYADGAEVQTAEVKAEENWTYTFNNLAKYRDGGIEIVYTIDEIEVPTGYTKSVSGNIITNTHTPETTEVTVTKAWSDNNDQDGIRPDLVNITLYADGIEVETAEVKASENWTYTFSNLTKYRDGGVEIVYTVDETVVPTGYTKSVDGYTVTNTHTSETTQVTVTKTWADNNDQDGIRPDSVKIVLYADGVEVQRTEIISKNNWSYTFGNLAKYRDGGVEMVYTIDEIEVAEGYTKTIDGYAITNTHTPETTQVTVTKAWADNNNQDGIRPGSVNITLYADGVEVQTAEVKASENWTYTFRNLAKYRNGGVEIVYTVDETVIPTGYTKSVSGNIITNTHTPEKTAITVTKVWADNNNQDGIRPTTVSVSLLANGELKETVNVLATNDWKHTFSNLDKYSAGQKINYTVVENNVKTGYTANVTGTTETGYTITNTHTPEKTQVKVSKVWSDNNNQDGIRPQSVSVSLLANGVVKETVNVLATQSWEYIFSNLDKKLNGQDIIYTVIENNVTNGYTAVVTGDATNGYTITNTHIPEVINIPVTKVWNDNNNYYSARVSVTVELKVGDTVKQTITISEADGWNKTFTNLPKYQAGQEINYTVSERAVEGYTTSISGDKQNGFTITNTYNNVTVNKKTLTSTETSEEEVNANVDVVFVLDTSSSMQGSNVTNMIKALNSAMTTILANSNNRVGVVGYSDDWYGDSNSTVLLELNHYTAKGNKNEFVTLSGNKDNTRIKSNVTELSTQTSRYVRGATYTQIGVKEGARLLTQASNTNTTGRTPVIILLTDGEPTRYTTAYSNVAGYTDGNGQSDAINAEGAYYNIMTARYYKQQIDNKYTDTTAQFYTIGIGMDENDAYQNALLNPNTANITKCRNSGMNTDARGIYTLLYNNYRTNGGTKTNFNLDLNYYSYADGAYLGEMDETKLNEILTKITTNITKYYSTTTTKTTNLNAETAKIELTNLDVNEKITIELDGVSQEYELSTLTGNGTVTLESGKYYMNLKATMFNNVKEIEITYYEASSTSE